MRVFDLFSGIGGFSLGLERAGHTTIAFCESDPVCHVVLRQHWPEIPIFGDVRTLHIDPGFVDILCGGFPCQANSTAARGRNRPEKDLWPEFARLIGECRPRWVLAENVLGLGARGIERVCGDLEEAGYRVWTFHLDAALPQRQRGRDRLVFLAYPDTQSEPCGTLDEEMAGLPWIPRTVETHPGAVGVDDGLPRGMDRLHCLGNAFSPQVAEAFGRLINRFDIVTAS